MPRTKEQKQKYNQAKRVKTFTTAVNNVKELLLNDPILKDIDISILTDDKVLSMIKILKKVAVINKNKAKLNIDVAPITVAPIVEPVAQPPVIAPITVVKPPKKSTPPVKTQSKKKKPVTVPSKKKKKSIAPVKPPKIKRQKLIPLDSIIKSSNSNLKKKYNILMYQYNSMVSDLENIPKYDTDRIARIEKSLDSMLERLKKMETSA